MTRRNESGFTSMWVLVLSMLTLAFGVVAFDLWRVFTDQRRLAARADAAAVAAAQAVDVGRYTTSNGTTLVLDKGEAEDLAKARLELDLGGPPGACGAELTPEPCWKITVQNPGDSGVPLNAAPSVTVELRQRVKLAQLIGDRDITATSTASPQVAN
jgi:uncharacterized membrane protein